MGLDAYVGTLTRYYAGQWETVIQQHARVTGEKLTVVYADGAPEHPSPEEAGSAVLEWRRGLSNELRESISRELDWPEGLEPPYFTDKPAWDCFGALLVFAAREQLADSRFPTSADGWEKDPAFLEVQQNPLEARYPSLTLDVELWLPGEESMVFRAVDAGGREVGMAFSGALLRDLARLNERTWRANQDQLLSWRRDGAEFGAPFETSARFGFAVMYSLAQEAVAHSLPVKLDY